MGDELLLIPGPTNLSPSVREVLARPQLSHNEPEFYEAFQELLELTRYVFVGYQGQPFVLTGSGTLAMECCAVSLMEPGDKALVVITGHFGKRFAEILSIHGVEVEELSFELGRAADPSTLDSALRKHHYKAIFITHVDTGNTVMNQIEELSKVGREHDALVVIDSVCGIGGSKLKFDSMGLDLALTASQKALGAPPGACLFMLSKRALDVLEDRRKPIPSYYLNLAKWRPIMEEPKRYLATPAVQIMLALRQALKEVRKEGIERRWRRHELLARALQEGLQAMGLNLVAEEGARADTVTGAYVKDPMDLQARLKRGFGIQVARGLYEYADRMIRIGHFANIGAGDVAYTLLALEGVLASRGEEVRRGKALEAALPYLQEASRLRMSE